MHDDHSGMPAARTAPQAAEQEAEEPRAGNSAGNTVAGPGVERPPRHPDPTRYGDWEKDGRCIDF